MPDLGPFLLPLIGIAIAFGWAFMKAVRRSTPRTRPSGSAAAASPISEGSLARLDRRVAIESAREEGRLTQDQYDRQVAAWEEERHEIDPSADR